MTNKNEIITLFQIKEKHRKKILNDTFSDLINQSLSISLITKMINEKLGVEGLVKENDIKYCRHYFKLNKTNKPIIFNEKPIPNKDNTIEKSSEVHWSNPDEGIAGNNRIKSKFLNNE